MIKNLLILLFASIFLSGCAIVRRIEYIKRIKGWEYVRIERQVPDKNCVYKIQEVCGEKSTVVCYNWFKQRAKYYGANVVILTEDSRSRTATFDNVAGPRFKSSTTISALADYYNCPRCQPMDNP